MAMQQQTNEQNSSDATRASGDQNMSSNYRWQVLDNSGKDLGFIEATSPEDAQRLAKEQFGDSFSDLGDCQTNSSGQWQKTDFPVH